MLFYVFLAYTGTKKYNVAMAENEKDKRKFISEKIVGRPITLKHAGKRILLALLCGLVFGAAAAFSMILINKLSPDHGSENISESAPSGESKDGSYDETPEDETEETGETEVLEETEPIEDIVRTEVENHEYSRADFESIISNVKEIKLEVEKSVVTVRSVSSDRGWFNDPIDTVDNYSGIIIGREGGSIDILTTEGAVINADSLEIIFSNGTKAAAETVRSSHYDNIAVIRVREEGISGEALSGIEPVTWGNAAAADTGDFIIAAGAPLGVVNSYDYGFINFVYENAPSPDDEIKRLYTDVRSDSKMGTFIFDDSGRFIGFAQGVDSEMSATGVASASNYIKVIEKLAAGTAIPFIGIEGQAVNNDMKASGMPEGVYVTGVIEDSPAYAAGIRRGDIVTSIADTACSDISEFSRVLSGLSYESPVKLLVSRQGAGNEYQEMEFNMIVGAR